MDDNVTIPALQKEEDFVEVATTPNLVVQSVSKTQTKMKVTVLVLGDSADEVSNKKCSGHHQGSNIVVFRRSGGV
jgi:hypothetical protein